MNKDWLDIDVLEDYLDGKLDAKGMHFVERQELDDPFVADALQGLRRSPKRKQALSILQKRLYKRISEKPVKRKMWGITTQRLSIAATATVAFVAVSILFFMRENNRKSADIALRKAQGIVVNLDTNASVGVIKPRPEDTLANMISGGAKSVLINEAIKKVKTNALAKNKKAIENENVIPQTSLSKKTNENTAKVNSMPAAALQSARTALMAALPAVENNKTITGKVISEVDGKPLSGATIKVAGINHTVLTDKDGLFTITIDSNQTKALSLSYIGFENAKAAIDDQKRVTVSLKEDQTTLNEAVETSAGVANTSTKASVAKGNRIILSGNVVNRISGKPVESAVVKLAGTKIITVTNANGFFALPINSSVKDKALSINAIGFKEILIKESDPIRFAISGNKSLSETASITGSKGPKMKNIPVPKIMLQAEQNLDGKFASDITEPIPVINYTQYLNDNNKLYNAKGPAQFVVLSFKVKKNGRPGNITVIKSLNAQADAEAKRLIQTGPDWILPKVGTDLVEICVNF